MTKSNREAGKAGELGGNVIEPIAAPARAPIDGEELGFNPAPGLVSDLLGEGATAEPSAYRWAPRPLGPSAIAPGQVGYLISGVLAEGPPKIDMDEDTHTFLRRLPAGPPIQGPRCGLEFDGATCCLDKDHPSHEHAAVAPGASFVWRAVPGAPIVSVYDGREGGPDSHKKLLDWMSDEISLAILGPTEKP